MPSQNIYEYKKIKVVDEEEWTNTSVFGGSTLKEILLKNKLNELIIEQNHLMKDFELYKKAFKRYVSEHDGVHK